MLQHKGLTSPSDQSYMKNVFSLAASQDQLKPN